MNRYELIDYPTIVMYLYPIITEHRIADTTTDSFIFLSRVRNASGQRSKLYTLY